MRRILSEITTIAKHLYAMRHERHRQHEQAVDAVIDHPPHDIGRAIARPLLGERVTTRAIAKGPGAVAKPRDGHRHRLGCQRPQPETGQPEHDPGIDQEPQGTDEREGKQPIIC